MKEEEREIITNSRSARERVEKKSDTVNREKRYSPKQLK
jgi:hypothetical protein